MGRPETVVNDPRRADGCVVSGAEVALFIPVPF